jgi:DNA-binding LacI/PurR family transcriptional regulator
MPRKEKKYATIRDVALAAGTSVATVSYVLTKAPTAPISDELQPAFWRRRTVSITAKTSSRPAFAAKAADRRRRIPQFSNIYYTRLCIAAENEFYRQGIIPMICDSNELVEQERCAVLNAISLRVDGVIIGPTAGGWKNVALLRQKGIPCVIVSRSLLPPEGTDDAYEDFFVGDDSYGGGFLGGSHLVQNGHREIGFVEWHSLVS